MDRRTLLRRGGALGALVLAGCSEDDTDGGGDTPTDTPTATPTETPAPTVTDSSISTVSSNCLTGEEGPYASATTDAGTVTVTGLLKTSNPCHEAALETVSYDSDTDTLSVDVTAKPSNTDDSVGCVACIGAVEYEATIAFADGVPGTVDVTHGGESVPADAGASGSTAPIGDASLRVTNVTGGQEVNSAQVQFGDSGTVTVAGTITGRNGCITAKLDSAAYDAETDTLRVAVVTTEREGTDDQMCTMSLVEISYEATVEFTERSPGTVEVRHDGDVVSTVDSGTATDGDA